MHFSNANLPTRDSRAKSPAHDQEGAVQSRDTLIVSVRLQLRYKVSPRYRIELESVHNDLMQVTDD